MSAPLRTATISALGAYRPGPPVPNAELPAAVRSPEEWMRTRTGIASRHFGPAGGTVVDLAVAAARDALTAERALLSAQGARSDPADIDLVLLASCSLPVPMPGGAPRLAAALGLSCGAIDLNAACAGFCYATATAADAVRTGSADRVLVVGAERMSDWLDWTDRRTAVLFGDGAGAALVTVAPPGAPGIGPVAWGSNGDQAEALVIDPASRLLQMDGRAVFRWATALAPAARRACELAGIEPAELAAFVPHQANLRIVTALARELGVSEGTVIASDVTASANTSAASIPLALHTLAAAGTVPAGAPVLLIGFGAGLSWAAQVVAMPATPAGAARPADLSGAARPADLSAVHRLGPSPAGAHSTGPHR